MKTVDILTVSQALKQAHVWHKSQNDFICTEKARVKIPKNSDKVAYLAGVMGIGIGVREEMAVTIT